MTVRNAYPNYRSAWCMPFNYLRLTAVLIILFMIGFPGSVYGQEEPLYEEIPLFLGIPRIGGTDITGVIMGKELFLPVTEVFDFLKIRNVASDDLETISGFFIDPEAEYLIDRGDNTIRYQEKTHNLEQGDLIRTESNLYLRSTYFGTLFGLDCIFNFRDLSVTVTSKLELPVIREMRLEEMRRNLTRLKGEFKADTTIGRSYPLFRFGMADWSAVAKEEINGESETRLNLTLGAMIAGGEATASINYSSRDPFSEKQQYYLWRYVNNDFTPLRQVMAGKIATQAISSIYSPVIGVQFTNTPTTYRRSFGSYTLSDQTEPGWMVELYINNTLIDYVKADASGFFTFEVPLVYGNSIVKLKYYGPWGEERTREQNINIPFNFLPSGTLEYNVSAGIVEDTLASRFSRARINYGVSRSLTLGAGAEYLSSLTSAPAMPFVSASLRLTNNLLLWGEYTHGVRAKGTLSYRMPSNLQLDLNYTWYDKDQKAINFNYREERKASLSMPLKIGNFSSYQRLSFNQIILPASQYSSGEWLFSGSVKGVSANLTTYAIIPGETKPYLYSNLSLGFRLPAGFVVLPQVQYSYTHNQLISAKMGIEKHLLDHAFLNASYEQNFRNDLKMAELGLRYDFSFAQAGTSVRQSNKKTSLIQYARGSLINDRQTRYLGADNRTNVGKGGISVVAFIDLNLNGIKESGEPKVYGLNLHASGGQVKKSERDTTIRIIGLEPYTNCFIELDPNSFDNIAWRLPIKSISVAVDPNILKLVEVPVTIAGEATGTVSLENEGIGRIIMHFFTAANKPAGKTLTENDGYFSYFGLAPGRYYVKTDTSQLNKLKLISVPDSILFTIKGGPDGDLVTDLNFNLRIKPGDTTALRPETITEPVVAKDTTYLIIHEVTEEVYTITEDSWAIQVGAFRDRSYAEGFRRRLETMLDKEVKIVIEGDYYRVRVLDLPTRAEVDENVSILNKEGFNELWIIKLIAMQQQRILITREDSLARIRETITERPAPVFSPDMAIQAGAFRNESFALTLQNRLNALVDKPVVIIHEDGFHKVRITGFDSMEELERFLPSLGIMGLKDVWIPPLRERTETTQPVTVTPDTIQAGKDMISPVKVRPDSTLRVSPLPTAPVAKDKPAVTKPPISIQIGVFHSRAQALRAKRRITSKLGLPVEIVPQWEYYRVIITGFYTREETYEYYPELAGLGYDSVYLIENE